MPNHYYYIVHKVNKFALSNDSELGSVQQFVRITNTRLALKYSTKLKNEQKNVDERLRNYIIIIILYLVKKKTDTQTLCVQILM